MKKQKSVEYFGDAVEVIDRFGDVRYIDAEHLNNPKTPFCRILSRWRGRWFYKKGECSAFELIRKENIKKF